LLNKVLAVLVPGKVLSNSGQFSLQRKCQGISGFLRSLDFIGQKNKLHASNGHWVSHDLLIV